MEFLPENAVAKVHPASREALPDDPLEMHGFELPGDPELMLRMLVEEYTRIGWGVDAIMRLAQEPNFTAFYAFRQSLGADALRQSISRIVARCGVMRVKTTETEPPSERLVQIELAP
jgi:hypothetical protein